MSNAIEPIGAQRALTALRDEAYTWTPPAAIEAAVLAKSITRRAEANPAPRRVGLWWVAGVPAALALCAAGVVSWRVMFAQLPGPQIAPASTSQLSALPGGNEIAIAIETHSTPFVALASAREIDAARAPVLRVTSVPRTVMPEYGFSFSPERAHESVRAEWLMSERGRALAVRFTDVSVKEY